VEVVMAKTKGAAPADAEVDRILDRFFYEEELTEAEAEEALARLKPLSGKIVARLLPRVTDPDPEVRAVACHLLGELADRSAVRPLRRMLGDATLDDEIRIEVFGLLADLGETLDQAEFAGSLRDPEAAMRRMLERGVARWQDPERLSDWVATVEEGLRRTFRPPTSQTWRHWRTTGRCPSFWQWLSLSTKR